MKPTLMKCSFRGMTLTTDASGAIVGSDAKEGVVRLEVPGLVCCWFAAVNQNEIVGRFVRPGGGPLAEYDAVVAWFKMTGPGEWKVVSVKHANAGGRDPLPKDYDIGGEGGN